MLQRMLTLLLCTVVAIIIQGTAIIGGIDIIMIVVVDNVIDTARLRYALLSFFVTK